MNTKAKSTREDVFSEWAAEFLHTRKMAAVLQMPGCGEMFVNNSHRFAFDGVFHQVRSSADCRLLLDSAFRQATAHCSDECNVDSECYCEKVDALFAATFQYCTFERIFRCLNGTKWSSGISFLRLRQREQFRTYDIFQVQLRRMPEGYGESFIEVRLNPIAGAQLEVQTLLTNPDGLTAKTLKLGVTLHGSDWLQPVEEAVPPCKAYEQLAQTLLEALNRLKSNEKTGSVKKMVLEQIRPIDLDYNPIKNFLCCLFSSNERHLPHKVSFLLKAINDALVVVPKTGPKIESVLEDSQSRPESIGKDFEISPTSDIITPTVKYNYRPKMDNGFTATKAYGPKGDLASPKNGQRQDNQTKGRFNMSLSRTSSRGYLKEFRHRAKVFERLLPRLRKQKQYANNYVALRGNKVVAHDMDLKKLLASIRAQDINPQDIYIDQVVANPHRTLEMDIIEV